MFSEQLEPRLLLASDFGDAPDPLYNTVSTNNGPSHVVPVTSLIFIGANVDTESEALANVQANGDDITTSPDDEDGLINPELSLQLTAGTQPNVSLRVTNDAGSVAMLSGWIDYNADGLFDNASERAQATVVDGTSGGIVTLTFPKVPIGFTGDTYARFRLSTDVAAENPVGPATDGEVEDYLAKITLPNLGTVINETKISETQGGLGSILSPALGDGDRFGGAIAMIGDINGDTLPDLVIGATGDDDGGTDRGAVWIVQLAADGTTAFNETQISSTQGGFLGVLDNGDFFGSAVASLGDFDGDGIGDLAVGAARDNDGGLNHGAVWMLMMNADRTVKSHQKISDTVGNFGGALSDFSYFGNSIASLGDLDGDGVGDLAVGVPEDNDGGSDRGAVWILFLNADGTVKSEQKISDTAGGFTGALDNLDRFGNSLANIGDIDGDGVADLGVGAHADDDGGTARGAVWLLMMNDDGTVKSHQKISDTQGNFAGTLSDLDLFGDSVAALGDANGDGVPDIAVGASLDDDGGSNRGAAWLLFLNSDGTVQSEQKISDTAGNFGGTLVNGDSFGGSLASLGDLDGDGVADLAVGAPYDDDGGSDRGAIWVLNLASAVDFGDAPDTGIGTGASNYNTLASDNGPSHGIVNNLRLGTSVDGEGDGIPNSFADGDDRDGVSDDETGVNDPLNDLELVYDSPSTVNLTVTNTTGNPATLSGWIDFNGDGVFDNVTERAQTLITGATVDSVIPLTFPVIPLDFVSQTYARFRLSTDVAAENPTGAAADGEVEDYAVSIHFPTDGTVKDNVKLSDGLNGFSPSELDLGDNFGSSVASLGDLDGDGVTDLAVGAYDDENGQASEGAVYVLLMNVDGTVKSDVKISDGLAGFTPTGLEGQDFFGISLANLGDLDGDGVVDLAVGAVNDESVGGSTEGAIYVLFLNNDGTVKDHVKISEGVAGFTPTGLDPLDGFGKSIANLGDLDGDGVIDLAVGAHRDENLEAGEGAVYILFMNRDGTVKSDVKISDGLAGFTPSDLESNEFFGYSVAGIGDLDGDEVPDLAVGAIFDGNTDNQEGALYILLLNSSGTVKDNIKISDGLAGFGPNSLGTRDYFGWSVANVGDLDGDGVGDLAVGAANDENTESGEGALHLLMMNSDGTVKREVKISDGLSGFAPSGLEAGDYFGTSVANVGDLNGDGVTDLAVGAFRDEGNDVDEGAVYLLFLARDLVVTNTNDSGPGSLRQAIIEANVDATNDVIKFDIPGSGPHVIDLLSPLPEIDTVVKIDGTSEPDYSGSPVVRIDGAGTINNGLLVSSSDSTVMGLSLTGFSDGLELQGGGNHTISDNYLGLTTAGISAPNQFGLRINDSSANTITDNVISGNDRTGILIRGATASLNLLTSNLIGTDPTGQSALPNGSFGVSIQSPLNFVGLAGLGNTISGNAGTGLAITASASQTSVQGNSIGTNVDGTSAIGNGSFGVLVKTENNQIGGNQLSGTGNTISGNVRHGLVLSGSAATGNQVLGNVIGTDTSGTAAIPNLSYGIYVTNADANTIGSDSPNQGNLISGNKRSGIVIVNSDNTTVEGNKVGTSLDGLVGIGNESNGIHLFAGASQNVVNRNQVAGNNSIQISIGGISTTDNMITDNMIGVNRTSSSAINGGTFAVRLASPTSTFTGNTVAGSTRGVVVSGVAATGNVVSNNSIGTNSSGNVDLGMDTGVQFAAGAASNSVTQNSIDFNATGIRTLGSSGSQNTFSQNSFVNNTVIGIDLAGIGPTANDAGDADEGPNRTINHPELQTSEIIGGGGGSSGDLEVTFNVPTLTSNATYDLTIEVFQSDAFGQGSNFLGMVTYTAADAAIGTVTRTIANGANDVTNGDFISATTTDADGNTSEFSAAVQIGSALLAAGSGSRSSMDVSANGMISALDALMIINGLSAGAAGENTARNGDLGRGQVIGDVNGDGIASALDALLVINYLSKQSQGQTSELDQSNFLASLTDTALSEIDEEDFSGEMLLF